MTFLGYVFHLIFHKPWSGKFFKSHMNHHLKQYPSTDFYSSKYRDAGKDNTVWLFAAVFAPIILTIIILIMINVIPLFMGLMSLAEMFFIGWLNNSMHDGFHVENSVWHKFWFFKKLEKLHYQHHVDMNTNYGIFSFVWDKILGTFQNTQ